MNSEWQKSIPVSSFWGNNLTHLQLIIFCIVLFVFMLLLTIKIHNNTTNNTTMSWLIVFIPLFIFFFISINIYNYIKLYSTFLTNFAYSYYPLSSQVGNILQNSGFKTKYHICILCTCYAPRMKILATPLYGSILRYVWYGAASPNP